MKSIHNDVCGMSLFYGKLKKTWVPSVKSPKSSTESPVPEHRYAGLNATEVCVSLSLANKPGIMKQENLCVIAHKKY